MELKGLIMGKLMALHSKELMERIMVPMEELQEHSGKQIYLQDAVCNTFLDDLDGTWMQ